MPNLGLEIKRRCGICGKVFIIKTLDSWHLQMGKKWAWTIKVPILAEI